MSISGNLPKRDSALEPRDRETAHKEPAYLARHADRMHDPDDRRLGFPIGSGRIEGVAKTLVKQRFAAGGMRGSHGGAQVVGTLRTLAHCDRWDEFWATRPFAKPEGRIA